LPVPPALPLLFALPFPPPLPLPFPPPLLALPLPFAMSLLRPLLFAFPVRFGVGSVFPLPPPGPGLPPGVGPFVTWLATGARSTAGAATSGAAGPHRSLRNGRRNSVAAR